MPACRNILGIHFESGHPRPIRVVEEERGLEHLPERVGVEVFYHPHNGGLVAENRYGSPYRLMRIQDAHLAEEGLVDQHMGEE